MEIMERPIKYEKAIYLLIIDLSTKLWNVLEIDKCIPKALIKDKAVITLIESANKP